MNFPKLLLALLAVSSSASVHADSKPEIKQTIDGFLRPVAAVFGPDERSLFVVNHAQGEAGTLAGESFVSKLSVDGSGAVAADRMQFLQDLTAPIDIDFSPAEIGSLPAGTMFLVAGSTLIQDEAGRTQKDLSQAFIGLIAVDPRTGATLKRLDLSPNAPARLDPKRSLLAPAALAFDKRGNLFIADLGYGGQMFAERQPGGAGLWRISRAGLENLFSGATPAEEEVEFIQTTSLPIDMSYDAKQDLLYFVTNHPQGRLSGSVFRLNAGRYEGISSMETVVRELAALSGIDLTPSGRVLLVGNDGELQFPKGKKSSKPVRFRPKSLFSSAGKIGILPLAGGRLLVAVPEQSSDAGLGNGQRLTIVELSADD